MLSTVEKILFIALLLGSIYAALRAAERVARIVRRGQGSLATDNLPGRFIQASLVFITQKTVLKRRLLPSIAHALIVWGFVYFLLGNLGDVLQGFIPNYTFMGTGTLGAVYRFIGDWLSIGVLVGMASLIVRRLVVGNKVFGFRSNTLIHPKAIAGIRRDSRIIGAIILVHVGAHFLGNYVHMVQIGQAPWWPPASLTSALMTHLPETAHIMLERLLFWISIGSLLILGPYFIRSKHIHIFVAPLNFMLKPKRQSIGQLDKLDMEDESITQYGAAKLEHLSQPQLLDAYACIMCNRCQDACPAYATGKALSPAALEINKRYHLNDEGAALAAGQESNLGLLDFAISAEAVWACTACGACVSVCPVNNEPMRDILDIRRNLALMENTFPSQLQQAFRGMERTGNPWTIAPEARMDWAKGLAVPTIEQNPDPDLLWWVGCAPATDPRAQKTAQAFARLLAAASVNYAVLGKLERCTGDSARRAGNEALFYELASANVETLNQVKPRRIVTTCPHCLHTLANEYGAFGGNYQVIHHTQLIEELITEGKLRINSSVQARLAFHDPCYLGRHNNIYDAPRQALTCAGITVTELPRHHSNSFCCGAGGAQMWKEEEHGARRVSEERFQEATQSEQAALAVGCPFCMIMLTDAATAAQSTMAIRDVAEIIAERIQPAPAA